MKNKDIEKIKTLSKCAFKETVESAAKQDFYKDISKKIETYKNRGDSIDTIFKYIVKHDFLTNCESPFGLAISNLFGIGYGGDAWNMIYHMDSVKLILAEIIEKLEGNSCSIGRSSYVYQEVLNYSIDLELKKDNQVALEDMRLDGDYNGDEYSNYYVSLCPLCRDFSLWYKLTNNIVGCIKYGMIYDLLDSLKDLTEYYSKKNSEVENEI